jgi:putative transposase
MRYQFITDHRDQFSVKRMCQALKVSRSGYYAWRQRPPSAREMANQKLVRQIKTIHHESNESYGSPRVYQELRALDVACSENRVARLMQQHDIRAKRSRRFRVTTQRNKKHLYAPNLLRHRPPPSRPDQIWLADITYIATGEGWLYLASVMDRFSRRIVGWAMDKTLASSLPKDALRMALQHREPPAGLVHHSDRGSQYTADTYQALLTSSRIQASMSGTGNSFDNAHKESFFGTLKTELIHHRRYSTRAQARSDIFAYIEGFYNTRRRHSSLGYLSPNEFEAVWLARIR